MAGLIKGVIGWMRGMKSAPEPTTVQAARATATPTEASPPTRQATFILREPTAPSEPPAPHEPAVVKKPHVRG